MDLASGRELAINLVLSSRPEPPPSSPWHPSLLPAHGPSAPSSSSPLLCQAQGAPHRFCLWEGHEDQLGPSSGVLQHFWEGHHIYTAIKNKISSFVSPIKVNREERFGASTRVWVPATWWKRGSTRRSQPCHPTGMESIATNWCNWN